MHKNKFHFIALITIRKKKSRKPHLQLQKNTKKIPMNKQGNERQLH